MIVSTTIAIVVVCQVVTIPENRAGIGARFTSAHRPTPTRKPIAPLVA